MLRLKLRIDDGEGLDLGVIGTPTPYRDKSGKVMHIGDIVQTGSAAAGETHLALSFVHEDPTDAKRKPFVDGIKDNCDEETGEIADFDVLIVNDFIRRFAGEKFSEHVGLDPFGYTAHYWVEDAGDDTAKPDAEAEADAAPKKVRGRIVSNRERADYGRVGTKTPYHDCNGKRLVVGDLVRISRDDTSLKQPVVCGGEDGCKKFFIMGIKWSCDDRTGEIGDCWTVEKIARYTELKDGQRLGKYLTFHAD